MDNKWQYQKSGVYKKENNPNYRGGKEVPCTFCGKPVYRRPSELKKNKNIFCSTLCHDDFRRKPNTRTPISEMHGPKHPRWAGIRLCRECGIELISRRDRQRGICQSSECRLRAKEKHIRKGENHPDWKGGKVTLVCQSCQKEFTVNPGKADVSKYCSKDCYGLGKRNRVTIQCLQCGKEFIVSAIRFNELNARFCSVSCSRSYQGKTSLESKVLIAIEQLGLRYIDEYRPKGTRRIFDFYLPDLNTLIEADGDFWHYSQWAKNKGQIKRDADKTKWAIDNGYKLIRLRESDVEQFGALALLQKELVQRRQYD